MFESREIKKLIKRVDGLTKRVDELEKKFDKELTEVYKRMTVMYDQMDAVLSALIAQKQIKSCRLTAKAFRRDSSFLWN